MSGEKQNPPDNDRRPLGNASHRVTPQIAAFAASPSPQPVLTQPAEAEVTQRAIEVIGDEREAMRWMGTPVRALDYATPISMLYDDAGKRAVLDVLGRLEHGVL